MTRDMELIRKILVTIQGKQDTRPEQLNSGDVDEIKFARHVEMLWEAGFIKGQKVEPLSLPYSVVLVQDLSWPGHDFAGVMKDETVWTTLKKAFTPSQLATLPLVVIKEAGIKIATALALKAVEGLF